MFEYCALPHLRPSYVEVARYIPDVEWYLRQVQYAYDPRVNFPTTQEVVHSKQSERYQAVILRNGNAYINWGHGEWVDYSSSLPAIAIELDYPTAKVEYANGEETLSFVPTTRWFQ